MRKRLVRAGSTGTSFESPLHSSGQSLSSTEYVFSVEQTSAQPKGTGYTVQWFVVGGYHRTTPLGVLKITGTANDSDGKQATMCARPESVM